MLLHASKSAFSLSYSGLVTMMKSGIFCIRGLTMMDVGRGNTIDGEGHQSDAFKTHYVNALQ